MRAFTRIMSASLAALAVAPPAADPQALNVGDCGCGGSGSCGTGGPCVCTPTGPQWPPGYPIPDGWALDGGGRLVAPTGPTVPPGTTVPTAVPIMPPGTAQTPNGYQNDPNWLAYARAGYGNQLCVPYKDAIRDCLFMKTVASPLTAVGIGATVNVDLSPAQGWFDMYYIDVMAYGVDGVAVGPTAFNMTIPTVVGCPTNACDTGLPINRSFFTAGDACCCGRPFRAIVPATSQGTPLRTAVTNLSPAAITVQVIGRGFCQSTRICV